MAENDDKQKRKLYFDELVLILFDAIDRSPGFFQDIISRFLYLDLQVFGLMGLRGLS